MLLYLLSGFQTFKFQAWNLGKLTNYLVGPILIVEFYFYLSKHPDQVQEQQATVATDKFE